MTPPATTPSAIREAAQALMEGLLGRWLVIDSGIAISDCVQHFTLASASVSA